MRPVIGLPYINRPDLFSRLLRSLERNRYRDYFDFHVINNSGKAGYLELGIGDYRVTDCWHNKGCAASWNTIINSNPLADYWLIVSNDIFFLNDDALKNITEFVAPRVNDYAGLFIDGFACFVITPLGIKTVGYFDENFYPAYMEDIDYFRRLNLSGLPCCGIDGVEFYHGEVVNGEQHHSATVRSDPAIARENGRTHQNNELYYQIKWGGKQGQEEFILPFGRYPLSFWQLDFSRYQYQQWNLG